MASIAAALASVLASASVPASETLRIYRCEAAGEAASLQDRPCPPGRAETTRDFAKPDEPAATATLTPPPPEPALVAPTVAEAEPMPPLEPLPPLWECVDFDGRRRESDDGRPRGRWVPLWVVGRDPDAPAQLFGRVGAAPARPVMRPGSGPTRATSATGGAQPTVYVQERCRQLSAQAACDRHVARHAELRRRAFNAQPSEKRELNAQVDALRRLLRASCGRN